MARNIGLALALNFTTRAAGTLAFIFIGRWGSVADAGTFSLALGYLAILSTLFVGLDDYLVRESIRSPQTTPALAITYAVARGGLSLLASLGLMMFLYLTHWYQPDDLILMSIIIFSLPLEAIGATVQAVLNARHHFFWPLVATVGATLARLGWVGWALSVHQPLTWLAWAWPLGSLVLVAVTLISANPFSSALTHLRFTLQHVGNLLRVLPSFSGVSLLSALEYQVDVVLLSVLLTHTDVAVYSAAATLMAIVLIGAQAYRMVLYPKLVETLAQRPAATGRWVRCSIMGMGGVAVLVALSIFLGAPILIKLIYGERLVAAAPVLRVLIWNVVLVFVTVPLVRLLVASNRQTAVWQLLLISAGVNVSANWALIPTLGPLGAAYARLLSSGLFCVMAGGMVWRHWPPLLLKATK